MAPSSSRTMQHVYLALAVIGYVLTGVPMVMESARTGNILFWTRPDLTTTALFANLTTTAFTLDLMVVVIAALIWLTREARRVRVPNVWVFWALTLLFGLGGTLPLFLYFR